MPAAYSRSESCDVLVPVCSLNCSTECKEVRELQSCRVVAIWLRRCHFTRTPWSPESVFNYQPQQQANHQPHSTSLPPPSYLPHNKSLAIYFSFVQGLLPAMSLTSLLWQNCKCYSSSLCSLQCKEACFQRRCAQLR